MDLRTFCRALPKVELHAHLNGSLSLATLKNLYKMQNPHWAVDYREWNEWLEVVDISKPISSLKECFKIFPVAHSLTTTPEYVFVAAKEVIVEFSEDNVIYLELRSTPRAIEGKMTKREYVEAIINAIKACESVCPSILVKLLISVDRKQGYESANENVRLAIALAKQYSKYVVGIDLSGDPTQGGTFMELLASCRKAGLKIAAHCAEVTNETEVMDILNFQPHRLGHCTCIHPSLNGSVKLFQMLLASQIPIELCLTSNVKCGTVPCYQSHQFKYLYEVGHPICISTDDKGIFATSLSNEFELVATHFGLEKMDLKDISRSSVGYAFASDAERKMLTALIDRFNN